MICQKQSLTIMVESVSYPPARINHSAPRGVVSSAEIQKNI